MGLTTLAHFEILMLHQGLLALYLVTTCWGIKTDFETNNIVISSTDTGILSLVYGGYVDDLRTSFLHTTMTDSIRLESIQICIECASNNDENLDCSAKDIEMYFELVRMVMDTFHDINYSPIPGEADALRHFILSDNTEFVTLAIEKGSNPAKIYNDGNSPASLAGSMGILDALSGFQVSSEEDNVSYFEETRKNLHDLLALLIPFEHEYVRAEILKPSVLAVNIALEIMDTNRAISAHSGIVNVDTGEPAVLEGMTNEDLIGERLGIVRRVSTLWKFLQGPLDDSYSSTVLNNEMLNLALVFGTRIRVYNGKQPSTQETRVERLGYFSRLFGMLCAANQCQREPFDLKLATLKLPWTHEQSLSLTKYISVNYRDSVVSAFNGFSLVLYEQQNSKGGPEVRCVLIPPGKLTPSGDYSMFDLLFDVSFASDLSPKKTHRAKYEMTSSWFTTSVGDAKRLGLSVQVLYEIVRIIGRALNKRFYLDTRRYINDIASAPCRFHDTSNPGGISTTGDVTLTPIWMLRYGAPFYGHKFGLYYPDSTNLLRLLGRTFLSSILGDNVTSISQNVI